MEKGEYPHMLYTLDDFTAEEKASKNEIYLRVAAGQKICAVCGDLTDVTPHQQKRHERYAPIESQPLRSTASITLTGIDADTGDEITEIIELNGAEPVVSKHRYASGMPSLSQVARDDASQGTITVSIEPPSDELLAAFFIDGKYVLYDDAAPRGVDAEVIHGLGSRRDGRPFVLQAPETFEGFHSAERLMDKAVIEWSDDAQRWTVY